MNIGIAKNERMGIALAARQGDMRMFPHLRSSRLCAVFLAATSIAWASSGAAADIANDGWYTADQADRGHQDFNNHCAQCHRPDLTGGPDVSPLWEESSYLNGVRRKRPTSSTSSIRRCRRTTLARSRWTSSTGSPPIFCRGTDSLRDRRLFLPTAAIAP